MINFIGDNWTILWQLRGGELEMLRTFDGHVRSVKTIAFRRTDSNFFATGGYDGCIHLWDKRADLSSNFIMFPHKYRGSVRSVTKLAFQVYFDSI